MGRALCSPWPYMVLLFGTMKVMKFEPSVFLLPTQTVPSIDTSKANIHPPLGKKLSTQACATTSGSCHSIGLGRGCCQHKGAASNSTPLKDNTPCRLADIQVLSPYHHFSFSFQPQSHEIILFFCIISQSHNSVSLVPCTRVHLECCNLLTRPGEASQEIPASICSEAGIFFSPFDKSSAQ